jgi:hypothetical protein
MPFTAQEVLNIANALIDYHEIGVKSSTIQAKPLMKKLLEKKKTFPGGKENVTENVKGEYTTEVEGYSGSDTVSYDNPANIKQAAYPWKELHAGITVTFTELKKSGITVVDSANGKETTTHTNAEKVIITNLLEDKLEDMQEGWNRGFNNICWQDGTQSAKEFAGIQYFLSTAPTTGTVGGIDRAANSWWRNRYNTFAHSVTNQTLTKGLRAEARQLARYGSGDYILLAGSGFLEKLEAEVAEKGYYTQTGFQNNGKNEIGMAKISMRGIGDFEYDPTLDDLSKSNYCYFIDTKAIRIRPIDGEENKKHNPARPYDQYTLYRAMTWSGVMTANQLNTSGVYIAS